MLSAPRPYLIRHQERRTGCTYERGVRAGARRCQNPSAPKGDGSKGQTTRRTGLWRMRREVICADKPGPIVYLEPGPGCLLGGGDSVPDSLFG
jgi:hypothetical protein